MKMKIKNEICLGDKVRCRYTGFTGIAVARTVFLNGCTQFSIAAKYDKKNPTPTGIPEEPFDEQSLDIIDTKLRVVSDKQKEETKEMLEALEEEEEDDEDSTGGPGIKIRRKNY